jgi:membrane protease YdiL (CAAX protease family)
MWVCPNCGEPHQDQFRECWKCVGAEIEAEQQQLEVAAPSPPNAPAERRLRGYGWFLSRAAAGFLVGTLLSLMGLNYLNAQIRQSPLGDLGQGLSPAGMTIAALLVGFVFAVLVGVFAWVVFPYEPTGTAPQAEENR